MLRQHSLVREGLIAGALGAGVVAAWFLILDLVHGRLFFTPGALGSALLHGARGMDEVQITAGTVLLYTLIHVIAFMALGFLAARIMTSADAEPRILLGAGIVAVILEVIVILVMSFTAGWLLDALSIWTVAIANLLAAAAMGMYLYNAHPQAKRDLQTNLEERDLGHDPARTPD